MAGYWRESCGAVNAFLRAVDSGSGQWCDVSNKHWLPTLQTASAKLVVGEIALKIQPVGRLLNLVQNQIWGPATTWDISLIVYQNKVEGVL